MSPLYRILAQLVKHGTEDITKRINTLHNLGKLTVEEYQALKDN